MKKESLDTIKSIYKKVDRYRCCAIGATAVGFVKNEVKEEKTAKPENKGIR